MNSVVAGAVSGMLFKSTRGLRPMMISGGLVASAAGAWAVSGFVSSRAERRGSGLMGIADYEEDVVLG